MSENKETKQAETKPQAEEKPQAETKPPVENKQPSEAKPAAEPTQGKGKIADFMQKKMEKAAAETKGSETKGSEAKQEAEKKPEPEKKSQAEKKPESQKKPEPEKAKTETKKEEKAKPAAVSKPAESKPAKQESTKKDPAKPESAKPAKKPEPAKAPESTKAPEPAKPPEPASSVKSGIQTLMEEMENLDIRVNKLFSVVEEIQAAFKEKPLASAATSIVNSKAAADSATTSPANSFFKDSDDYRELEQKIADLRQEFNMRMAENVKQLYREIGKAHNSSAINPESNVPGSNSRFEPVQQKNVFTRIESENLIQDPHEHNIIKYRDEETGREVTEHQSLNSSLFIYR
jgi:hypothetical protein